MKSDIVIKSHKNAEGERRSVENCFVCWSMRYNFNGVLKVNSDNIHLYPQVELSCFVCYCLVMLRWYGICSFRPLNEV